MIGPTTRPRRGAARGPARAAIAIGIAIAVLGLAAPREAAAEARGPAGGAPQPGSTGAATAVAAAAAGAATAAAELPKKDRLRAAKAPRTAPPPRAGQRAPAVVNLYNQWTREWLAVRPDERPGPDTVARFLRDHYTNEHRPMEPRLLASVLAAARHFRRDTAIVVSAFRHPKHNLLLRKKGRQVARESNHTRGTAVDFYLPGIDARRLQAWALSQGVGGVGLYPASGFIHIDTGPVRTWSGE